ncbi:MAG: choice-of-anchor J domain-containing protein [Bacteroidales bacterium]
MNKYFLFIILCVFSSYQLMSQTTTLFSENFETKSKLSGFKLENIDKAVPADTTYKALKDSAWVVRNVGNNLGNAAVATSNYNPSRQADDWLISPPIRLGDASTLFFDLLSVTNNTSDTVEIRISNTEPTIAGCLFNQPLTTIITNSNAGVNNYELPLNQYANQTVYIGFRLHSKGGGVVAVDNISVVENITQFISLNFLVDMKNYILSDVFDTKTDFVDIVGNFNAWDGSRHVLNAGSGNDSSIYSITISGFKLNDLLEFKFRINGSWNDSTVEFPHGKPNRTWTVSDSMFSYQCLYNNEGQPFYKPVGERNVNISVYPNPFVNNIRIKSSEAYNNVKIYSQSGRLVYEKPVANTTETIDLSLLKQGTYIVSLYNRNQLIGSKLIIKLNHIK